MSGIVEALQEQENALLESPTGSGKSLALLCGALAWLESQKEEISKARNSRAKELANNLKQQGIIESPYFADDKPKLEVTANPSPKIPNAQIVSNGCDSCSGACATDSPSIVKNDDMNLTKEQIDVPIDGQNPQTTVEGADAKWKKAMELKYESETPPLEKTGTEDDKPTSTARSQLIPKIYFGSRTHKQITQLVKELRSNTVYRPKMAVLGSRNHYCINPILKNVANKNDACQELLDSEDKGCFYRHHANKLSDKFSQNNKSRVWDMEDLVSKGKSLSDEAHNIEDAARDAGGLEVVDEDLELGVTQFSSMCDDNFLSDSSRKLHNLSKMLLSILRNQTKFSLKQYEESTEIWTSQDLLSSLSKFGLDRHTIRDYDRACQHISKAIKDKKEMKKRKRDGLYDAGPDMAMLDGQEEEERNTSIITVSPRILRIMEGIITIVSRLLDADLDCLDDYKIALVESVVRSSTSQGKTTVGTQESPGEDEDEDNDDLEPQKKKRKGKYTNKGHVGNAAKKQREFKFWCLNPGVIFRPLSLSARSVILTSGTLSPMESFASELQTTFKIQLETDHVIDKSQVWTGVLPYGPTQIKLDGTYQSASSYSFQDELGRVVERIIETTPHGVLCFLSSYSLMDSMINRWKATGQYAQLCTFKKVIQEPRKATNKQFDKILKDFYTCISRHVAKGSDGGALLFAVFRGKCSEGIDFTDSNCRAVLAVSIPFPGLHDLKIRLKKEYNDQQSLRYRQRFSMLNQQSTSNPTTSHGQGHMDIQGLSHSTGTSIQSANKALAISRLSQGRALLSGKRWYEIQAFRAYNQAIGRCIRHQRDWGAMVFLDFRFSQSNNQQNLSKWVRPLVRTFKDFGSGIDDMRNWIKHIHTKPNLGQQANTEVALTEELLQNSVMSVSSPVHTYMNPVTTLKLDQDDSLASTVPPIPDVTDPLNQVETDVLYAKNEHVNGVKPTTDSGLGNKTMEPQNQGSFPSLFDLTVGQDWDDNWDLSPQDDLQGDSKVDHDRSMVQEWDDEVINPKAECGQISHPTQQWEEDVWGPTLEAEVTANFDSDFDEECDDKNTSLESVDDGGMLEILKSDNADRDSTTSKDIVAHEDLSSRFENATSVLDNRNIDEPTLASNGQMLQQDSGVTPRSSIAPHLSQTTFISSSVGPSTPLGERSNSVSWVDASTTGYAINNLSPVSVKSQSSKTIKSTWEASSSAIISMEYAERQWPYSYLGIDRDIPKLDTISEGPAFEC
ncbi:Fanconi anemia group J protein [Haplosporangium sp. Z 27]|nr:Fanconi anemia group J protein [Haplosporangium sp. Z 27]